MSKRRLSALCLALIAAIIAGCGVEVGNPSEPTPTQPKENDGRPMVPGLPNVPIESVQAAEPVEPVKIDARYLVENQYDEAITASLDFAFDSSNMSGQTANQNRTCGVLGDGSLQLNHQETNSQTRTSGESAGKTLVTESFSRVSGSRMQSVGQTLACDSALTKPRIDWSSVSDVVIDGTRERTNSRLIVMDPSQQFVRESSVKASGTQQSTVKKVKFDQATGLQLQRSMVFGTDMELSNRAGQMPASQMRTRIETMADAPLAIEESYNQESRLKSVKITSGSVSARKTDDGLTVIMRYNNVILDADSGCRPTSGTITGEIFSAADPGKPMETFSIAFTDRQNLIVYADGTGSKLEFEPCRIETDWNGGKDNGPGREGGGRNN